MLTLISGGMLCWPQFKSTFRLARSSVNRLFRLPSFCGGNCTRPFRVDPRTVSPEPQFSPLRCLRMKRYREPFDSKKTKLTMKFKLDPLFLQDSTFFSFFQLFLNMNAEEIHDYNDIKETLFFFTGFEATRVLNKYSIIISEDRCLHRIRIECNNNYRE